MYGLTQQSPFRPQFRRILRIHSSATLLAAVLGIASLIWEYGGFDLPPAWVGRLHLLQGVVIGIFMVDRILRVYYAHHSSEYLRAHLLDFILLAVFTLGALSLPLIHGRIPFAVSRLGVLYVILIKGYLLGALLLRGISLNMTLTGSDIPPAGLLVGSFGLVILVGTGLLMLPAATPSGQPITPADALFTSVSATCVTGLIVRDTGTAFTTFGQTVILVQIQLGALGIMLFGTALAMALGRGRLSSRGTQTMGKMLLVKEPGRVRHIMGFVIVATLLAELVGAAVIYPVFRAGGNMRYALWQSVFHSISAFCNAGFSLSSNNMVQYRGAWQMLGVLAPLIVLGGLGFPVLYDLARYARGRMRFSRRPTFVTPGVSYPRPKLSLHTKLALTATAILLVVGPAGLLLSDLAVPADHNGAPLGMGWGGRLGAAVFQSVSARTAGFNTIDVGELSPVGKLWICVLMLIGGSPASTAGGLKTVAVAILVLGTISTIRQRPAVDVFRRSVPDPLFHRAAAIAVLYLCLVATVTGVLVAQLGYRFAGIDLFFEATSACGTVGLSTGVTPHLPLTSKLVVTLGMFAGRLGPLTLLAAISGRGRRTEYTYPQESVLIG